MAIGALLPILFALIFTAMLEASVGFDSARGKVSHAAVYIAYFLVFWVFLAILWLPLWLAFQFLVLPRNRDYLADAQAVLFTRNPEAVARVIEQADIMRSEPIQWGAFTINHMFFNQPLEPPHTLTRFTADLLNAHPPAASRVSRVQSLY
jgi:Zn-dependent protease with chaperone function